MVTGVLAVLKLTKFVRGTQCDVDKRGVTFRDEEGHILRDAGGLAELHDGAGGRGCLCFCIHEQAHEDF